MFATANSGPRQIDSSLQLSFPLLFERVLESFVRLPVFNRVPDVYHPGRGLNHKATDLSMMAVGVSRNIRMLNPQLKHVSYDRDKLAPKPFYPETV